MQRTIESLAPRVEVYSIDDVLLLTRAAMEGLEVIWRDGYRYSKAEILMMDLRKRGQFTGDLFTP